MTFFDAQFLLYDPELFHAFRPVAIAFIKLLEMIPVFRSPKAPAVKHDDPITLRHKGRSDVLPNLGAAKTMVHEDNDVTFTMNLIINPELIDCLEWHGLLLGFLSPRCSPSTHGSKAGASLRLQRGIL
jgi:hypothetical protein